MDKLKFDLTTKEGLQNLADYLETTKNNKTLIRNSMGATAIIDVDIEGMISDIRDLVKHIFDRIIDLFDDTKKLEKQMELAKQTIEIARLAGAKSIDITINSKIGLKFTAYINDIDASITGKLIKNNSIIYSVTF